MLLDYAIDSVGPRLTIFNTRHAKRESSRNDEIYHTAGVLPKNQNWSRRDRHPLNEFAKFRFRLSLSEFADSISRRATTFYRRHRDIRKRPLSRKIYYSRRNGTECSQRNKDWTLRQFGIRRALSLHPGRHRWISTQNGEC